MKRSRRFVVLAERIAVAVLAVAVVSGAKAQSFQQWPPRFDLPPEPPGKPSIFSKNLLPYELQGQWLVGETKAIIEIKPDPRHHGMLHGVLVKDTLEYHRRGDELFRGLRVDASRTSNIRSQSADAIVYRGQIANPPDDPGGKVWWSECFMVLVNRNQLTVAMEGHELRVYMSRVK